MITSDNGRITGTLFTASKNGRFHLLAECPDPTQ